MNNSLSAALVVALALLGASPAQAANIVLVNLDRPGVGLNDPTPATPTGGNPGTTLGQQRQIAYQYAMDLWGALLKSDAEIRVQASFAPLECTPGRIVLGQAYAINSVHASQIPGARFEQAWYPISMANAIAGRDLDVGGDDINTAFSSALDLPACRAIGSPGWHYGLRGNGDNPEGKSNFLNVIMHEIGHGLGVSGSYFAGTPWNFSSRSNQFNASMGELVGGTADQFTALTTPGDVVWTGATANPAAALLAENRLVLEVSAPQQGRYDIAPGYFGPRDPALFPRGEIVVVRDEAAAGQAATSRGCDGSGGEPRIANGEALRGKIALVDRNTVCRTGLQAVNVQAYGAIGLISVSNEPGDAITPAPGAVGAQVTIPVIGVSQPAGAALRAAGPVLSAGLRVDPDRFYGLDAAKRLRLYTPALFQGGSTFSHVDTDMSPNALMEPRESASLNAHVFIDVALDMFEDMGWPSARGETARLGDCDTGVPMVRDSVIPGANIVAHSRMCAASSGGSRSRQLRCMSDQLQLLYEHKHIGAAELGQARRCVARL